MQSAADPAYSSPRTGSKRKPRSGEGARPANWLWFRHSGPAAARQQSEKGEATDRGCPRLRNQDDVETTGLVVAWNDESSAPLGSGKFRAITTATLPPAIVNGIKAGPETDHRTEIRRALALQNVVIQFKVEDAVENGYDDTAIEYLGDSLTTGERLEDSIRRKALVKLGGAYFRKGQRTLALLAFLEALRLDDRDHQTLNTVGVIYMEGGKLIEALPWYQRALEIDPLNTMARANLAITLHSLGRIAEAVPLYRENLRLRREWPIGANNLVWILATSPDGKMRNGSEALALAEKACAATGNKDAGFLATLAAAQAETGNFARAIATSQRALKVINPDDKRTKENIAKALAAFQQRKPWRDPPPAKS